MYSFKMHILKLNLKKNSYNIIIGSNILNHLGKYIRKLNIGCDAYVITNALNSSGTNSDLTLMSGANKATVSNDEEITVNGKKVDNIILQLINHGLNNILK